MNFPKIIVTYVPDSVKVVEDNGDDKDLGAVKVITDLKVDSFGRLAPVEKALDEMPKAKKKNTAKASKESGAGMMINTVSGYHQDIIEASYNDMGVEWNNELQDYAEFLFNKGYTKTFIAEEIGCSLSTIIRKLGGKKKRKKSPRKSSSLNIEQRILKTLENYYPPSLMVLVDDVGIKWSEDIQQYVDFLLEKGKSKQDIAEHLGCSLSTVVRKTMK